MNKSICQQELETLLDYLQQNYAYNLPDYNQLNLIAQLQDRMQQLKIEKYSKYLQYLQDQPEELNVLINTILKNSTELFSKRDSWDYLANKIIPQIIKSKHPDERIRVWVAGCAFGQEAYAVSMLLAKALGMEQYLERVQIFATDIEEDALKQGRQGSYSDSELADIPCKFLSEYCKQIGSIHVFCSELRRSIIFGRHDLVKNAPISKIDLLVCRNILKYFDAKTYATILLRFHFALNNNGFLFLEKTKNLTNDKQIFIPVSMKHSIFTKAENLSLQKYLQIRPESAKKKVPDSPVFEIIHFWQAAFQNSLFALLAVDARACLILANEQAYTLFGLKNDDLGVQMQDLEIGQIVNFRELMKRLNRDRYLISEKNIEWTTSHSTRYFDIHITPIIKPSGSLIGANLTFMATPSPNCKDLTPVKIR
ncbi:CheR family methyltransferase [Nostoc sp. DSM 114167]|jgi:two-component system CheB/CheR fusion protein|uniref:CheR family methyltransferase n=1 Tax=Nostoc sp. DSM 114167 TaxID=3439050 RepID=UPI004045B1E8